ncbi:MAG: hypothetical protein CGU28_00055 [Candidatus Dactylopiibacterium carminicum]|uniref:Chemotaxis methyl-accepting receptor HlyB-like 4HB MCP domain-containing protein n=1 Tax=Candidatus Dactylopiibacterium carminicum TaxID=857335 RepID=A0A272F0K9_9RHOO|nr:MCP four helix bundle domain-containing protein [Candidatus Dactylopiibacterium carminicum]KAF7598052.1 hypothetical protein BGI27_15400 [Candidatus Dactylopiibacterium carminicum]PAS95400.1 MAG: hypothetical protein CGU29_00755 [Candidatus Dactylopiibacterium carminicum]PAS98589.1 MAG: hypothetical protein CGU28_00055 [Candidatus Dactylopiibacterium carminicum]
MRWFDNLRFRNKLLINFLVCSGLLIAALLLSTGLLGRLGDDVHHFTDSAMPAMKSTGNISELRLRYRVRSLEYLLPGTPEQRGKLEESLKDLDAEVQKSITAHASLVTSDQQRQVLEDVRKRSQAYRESVDAAVALVRAGDEEGAQGLRRKEWVERANALRDKTNELAELTLKEAELRGASAVSHADYAKESVWALLVISCDLSIAFAMWFAMRIGRSLEMLVQSANHVASGDLTHPCPVARRTSSACCNRPWSACAGHSARWCSA